jgi:glycosyltransferase involved in cell wall biosynthesis
MVDICVAPEPSDPFHDRSTANAMMEYMAMCKPIVAFDLPEYRFTAQEGAVYAHPNDELDFARNIAALMDNPELCLHMGQAGRARVEEALAWHRQAPFLLQVYDRVLGGRAGDTLTTPG